MHCPSIQIPNHELCPLRLIRTAPENEVKQFHKFDSVYLYRYIIHIYDALNESDYAEMPGELSAMCAMQSVQRRG